MKLKRLLLLLLPFVMLGQTLVLSQTFFSNPSPDLQSGKRDFDFLSQSLTTVDEPKASTVTMPEESEDQPLPEDEEPTGNSSDQEEPDSDNSDFKKTNDNDVTVIEGTEKNDFSTGTEPPAFDLQQKESHIQQRLQTPVHPFLAQRHENSVPVEKVRSSQELTVEQENETLQTIEPTDSPDDTTASQPADATNQPQEEITEVTPVEGEASSDSPTDASNDNSSTSTTEVVSQPDIPMENPLEIQQTANDEAPFQSAPNEVTPTPLEQPNDNGNGLEHSEAVVEELPPQQPTLHPSETLDEGGDAAHFPVITNDSNTIRPESSLQDIPVEEPDGPLKTYKALLTRVEGLMAEQEFNHALAQLTENVELQNLNLDENPELYPLAEQHVFLLIEITYQLGLYDQAEQYGLDYIKRFGNGPHFAKAYFFLSASLTNLGKPLVYETLVREELFEHLTNREAKRLKLLLINDALEKNRISAALAYLKMHFPSRDEEHLKWLNRIIESIRDLEDVELAIEENQDSTILAQLYLKKIQLTIRDGHFHAAQDFILRLKQSGTFDEQHLSELNGLEHYVEVALKTNPNRIGVLLPFSHRRFGSLAEEVRDGLTLALRDLSTENRPLQLVFRDSEPPTTSAKEGISADEVSQIHIQNMVRELVEDEGVITILGPLAKKTSNAAGRAASAYKVPVISFSLTEDIGENLPFLFRFQRSRMKEAVSLADYAMDYLGARRFVLFYPTHMAGFRMMKVFSDRVKEKGGVITGITRVKKDQVDFQDAFLSFTGGYRKISDEERDELEKSRERLESIVDFDAIFAPFDPNTINIISSFMSLFKADKAWILADSSVNIRENQLLIAAGNVRFVDSHAISDVRTYLQPFYEDHWRLFNYRRNYQAPTSYTIYGYEALEIIAKLINNPDYHNRESLRNAIQNLQELPTLTGNVTTGNNGEIEKKLNVLRLRRKVTHAIF